MVKHINVVGAVIVRDGKILCAQRGPDGSLPGLWEFPGGKIEVNETPDSALKREIKEELHSDVTVGEKITTTSHEYDFGIVHLTTYYCALEFGDLTLTEHSEIRWLEPSALNTIAWAPADIPAVEQIMVDLG